MLQKGWTFPDSAQTIWLEPADWFNYLNRHIYYPKKCTEADISENIFFRLHYNEKGKLEKLTLLKGNDPALVYAAWLALQKRPGIKNPYNTKNRSFDLILPLRFRVL
jgi:hypothetical protein